MSLRDASVIRTAIAVQRRFGEDRAGFLAAAMSYYAFLALFPLLLLAMSIIGFALANDPSAQQDWARRLSESVPGLEPLIGDNLRALVSGRGVTGALGLAGLLWSGLGLANAGTTALSQVFGFTPQKGIFRSKAWSLAQVAALGLLSLAGLAMAGFVSNLPVSGWAAAVLGILGAILTVGLDFLLFLAAYRLLSERRGPGLSRLRPGALLGAIGWTILQLVGSWYAGRTVSGSAGVYGTFAATVGILVLLHLAARVFLYGAELNAVMARVPSSGKAKGRLAAA